MNTDPIKAWGATRVLQGEDAHLPFPDDLPFDLYALALALKINLVQLVAACAERDHGNDVLEWIHARLGELGVLPEIHDLLGKHLRGEPNSYDAWVEALTASSRATIRGLVFQQVAGLAGGITVLRADGLSFGHSPRSVLPATILSQLQTIAIVETERAFKRASWERLLLFLTRKLFPSLEATLSARRWERIAVSMEALREKWKLDLLRIVRLSVR